MTEKQAAERLKRKTKPSTKSIENRIQSDKAKLDRLWEKVQKCISQLQDAPNSVDEIRQAISQVRSNFNIYQETWLSFADFLAHSGTPQCLQERVRMEGIINNHKQFVHENITQGNRRKEEIMLEMRSLRSSSGSRASSMSSTALRARARAEVAAAIKKAELQKKRLLVESQSTIQQAELALARHKLDEQARLEAALRLEEAAAVAVAKANAIDDELGFGTGGELPHLDLPEENSRQKVQHFIENQCIDPTPNTQVAPLTTPNQPIPSTEHVNPTPNAQVVPSSTPNQPIPSTEHVNPTPNTQVAPLNTPNQPIPSTEHVNPTPNAQVVPSSTPNQPIPSTEHAPAPQLLNPTASTFTPNRPSDSSSNSDQNLMKSCIKKSIMARRELVANKIEKFDNSPENFHTWKLSFKNMTRNINITPSEELSLIIEYSSTLHIIEETRSKTA